MSDPFDDPKRVMELVGQMEFCADSLRTRSAEPGFAYLRALLVAAGRLAGAVVDHVEASEFHW